MTRGHRGSLTLRCKALSSSASCRFIPARCAVDDQSSCPRTSPHRLRPSEVEAIGDMVTSPDYRHVPTGTLAVLAQRLGRVSASPSTWYRLVRKYRWRRPRVRVRPAKPKVGLRTTGPDETWHIDTTVIRLVDGTRAYLHAVIDHFSRRILAWRVADTFAPGNSVAVLLEASRGATRSANAPVVLADAGVGNVNAQVDELIDTGVLRPSAGLHGAEGLELDDRSVVAVPETPVALPSPARQRSRPSGGWWRSTFTNTMTCFHIPRFEDRRRTRCTSALGTRCRRT